MCRRPAVSTSSTSTPREVAAFTASKTTAAGSAPAAWWITSTSIRRPHSWSCSMAAARKVSAAAISTCLPSALSDGGQLGGGGGLARAVDAQHEDHGGMRVEVERRRRRPRAIPSRKRWRAARTSWLEVTRPALDLVADSLDEGARRGRAQVGRDQGLLELLQHRLVDRTGDGEDGSRGPRPSARGCAAAPAGRAPRGSGTGSRAREAGRWGSSSRWITVPFGPSGGRALPFSATSTPPALPMVTRKRRSAAHSRLAPAGSSSSVTRPSSVWTRIHVAPPPG